MRLLLSTKNTKIWLNGAIFSFAFGGHFSCLENSGHSEDAKGSIVRTACLVKAWRPHRHLGSTAGIHSALRSPAVQQHTDGKATVPWIDQYRKEVFTSDCVQH